MRLRICWVCCEEEGTGAQARGRCGEMMLSKGQSGLGGWEGESLGLPVMQNERSQSYEELPVRQGISTVCSCQGEKQSELCEKKVCKRRHVEFVSKGVVGMPVKGLVGIPALSVSTSL